MTASTWKVVGGVDKGGIIVREGEKLSSATTCPDRISTGAIIQQMERAGNRLRFRRLSGNGPKDGWVSITLHGKELLNQIHKDPPNHNEKVPPLPGNIEEVSPPPSSCEEVSPQRNKTEEVAAAVALSSDQTCTKSNELSEKSLDAVRDVKCNNTPILVGSNVLAFYNAYESSNGYHYVHSPANQSGEFPIIGLSAGWLPAEVLANDRKLGKVKVRFDGGFWDSFEAFVVCGGRPQLATREVPNVRKGWNFAGGGKGKEGKGKGKHKFKGASLFAPTTQVVPIPGQAFFKGHSRSLSACMRRHSVELSLNRQAILPVGQSRPQPLLSIVCIRWYDYWTEVKHSDYNLLNDGFLRDIFMGPGSVQDRLPRQYEVYSVFIKRSSDLSCIDPHKLRSMLQGQNIIIWYFLWPSLCDNASYEFSAGGFVDEHLFFQLVHRMERLPLRTGWPHPAHLYRQLCGKLWIPQMCLNKEFRVPPTTRVHYADFKQNPRRAATKALEFIMQLRKRLWQKEEVSLTSFRGVAKLGFSWGGMDVLPFKGLDSLIRNLYKLFETKGCQNNVCIVQELIPDVVAEHRILCFWDERQRHFAKEPVWMVTAKAERFGRVVDDREFGYASSIVCPRGNEARMFFDGDTTAWRTAESEASRIVDKWLLWFKTMATNPPQVTRIDFLVTSARQNLSRETAVWTCEVGECGASLCSVEVVGRNLAALNNAVLRDDSGHLPISLPTVMPRNRGEKS